MLAITRRLPPTRLAERSDRMVDATSAECQPTQTIHGAGGRLPFAWLIATAAARHRVLVQNQIKRRKANEMGRKPIHERPMTGAERFQRYRLRKAAKIYEEHGVGSRLMWGGLTPPGWRNS